MGWGQGSLSFAFPLEALLWGVGAAWGACLGSGGLCLCFPPTGAFQEPAWLSVAGAYLVTTGFPSSPRGFRAISLMVMFISLALENHLTGFNTCQGLLFFSPFQVLSLWLRSLAGE